MCRLKRQRPIRERQKKDQTGKAMTRQGQDRDKTGTRKNFMDGGWVNDIAIM